MNKPNLKNSILLHQWILESSSRIGISGQVGGDPERATAYFAEQLVGELMEMYKSNPDMAYAYALSEAEISKDESAKQMWLSVCKVLDERLGLKKENGK